MLPGSAAPAGFAAGVKQPETKGLVPVPLGAAATSSGAAGPPVEDIKIEFKDMGDALNEVKERELEQKVADLKASGLDAATLERWVKALQTWKKKNMMARKKRTDQQEKQQAVEIFEQKQRLCERKRTLETRIATLTKLGMSLQVDTLVAQLGEVNAKLRGDK